MESSLKDQQPKDSLLKHPFLKTFVAGALAGLVSRTATAPLDRLRVQLQVHPGKLGSLQASREILARGGWKAFYVGNGVNVIKATPESAIKFAAYEGIKRVVSCTEMEEESFLVRLASGGLAGGIGQAVIYPIETLKTRLQTAAPQSLRTLARDMYMKEGFRAFYRGLTPSLIGIIPYAGVDLSVYATLKDKFSDQENSWVHLGCGMVSGAIAATCAFPFQVIRTRLQARTIEYNGMVDAFRKTLSQEGCRAVYKGLGPSLMKVAPAAALTYYVLEKVKQLI